MNQIQAIKDEIERRIQHAKDNPQRYPDATSSIWSLQGILSFLESLEKEQEPKGYDEAYIKEKIALATKNGSWRESPEKEQYAGETMVEKDKIDTAFTRMMEKEQDAAKDLQWAAMEYASKAALLSSSTAGWRTSDITDAYKAGYEHGCRHAAVLYDDMEKEKQRRCEEEKSEIPIIRGWVARDIHGTLRLYGNDAADGMGIRTGELPSPYKELTAEDEPIEVELTISRVIK